MKASISKFCKTIFSSILLYLLMTSIPCANASLEKTNFWNSLQKGANIFNKVVTIDDIKAAKNYGIKFIRLSPDKFASKNRDFLIGDADNYQSIDKVDLKKLVEILDMCHAEQMPVVLTMLSLPGSRWKQNNNNQDDLRIWKDEKFRSQAAIFWRELASELKNHPAIVGYNILNEPHPERMFSKDAIHISAVKQPDVQALLYDFYKLVISNIRLSDPNTPIILDSSAYADAKTFELLRPHVEKNILYSFHIYEPYEYTNLKINNGKYKYGSSVNGKVLDKAALEDYMSTVGMFQKTHNIPSNKILVGEFGGHRMTPGLDHYFEDLISIFINHGWHFAFYSFREDNWDGMDYELGTNKLPWSYWQDVEQGKTPNLERKSTYPAFSVIKKTLQK